MARQLAGLYRVDHVGAAEEEATLDAAGGGGGGGEDGGEDGGEAAAAAAKLAGGAPGEDACAELWTVQHVLLPAIRRGYEPPSFHASNGAVVQVACTEMLYKIFERC